MSKLEVRPWGSYEVMAHSTGYQVKRLVIKPSSRLSLQWHSHRAERWVVVSGTASVILEDSEFVVGYGGIVDIPQRAVHRLINNDETEDLIVIEVQIGDYLGEDDIVRVEDDFGRTEVMLL